MAKGVIHRFKTIVEQTNWELRHRLEEGWGLDEIDRFEYIRLRVRAYTPGVYRFKTLKEKQADEFNKVMKAWEVFVQSEKNR